MKSLLLFPVFLASLYTTSVSAQSSIISGDPVDLTKAAFLDYLRDANSTDVFNPDIYAGVEGSPYLFDDWAYARIKLIDNRSFDSVLIRLNLFENKIHFKDNNGRERMIAVQVKQIEIRDESSKWDRSIFVSGYGKDVNTFYQVLADGKKLGYLKQMNIFKKEQKVFNAPNKNKFELQDGKLFLFSHGTIYEESKNCSSLMEAFGSDSKVASYVSANDIKCNKEKDLKKLVDYYNSY